MAVTTNIDIDNSEGWKEIAATGSGFVTASKSLEYAESADVPAETLVGHHLKTMESFRYQLSGSKLYGRGACVITFSGD